MRAHSIVYLRFSDYEMHLHSEYRLWTVDLAERQSEEVDLPPQLLLLLSILPSDCLRSLHGFQQSPDDEPHDVSDSSPEHRAVSSWSGRSVSDAHAAGVAGPEFDSTSISDGGGHNSTTGNDSAAHFNAAFDAVARLSAD
jgi:hypothetical protein